MFSDGFEETAIGDPETDQALAEFDFLADENKSDISDNDAQSKEQGRWNNVLDMPYPFVPVKPQSWRECHQLSNFTNELDFHKGLPS